MNSINDTFRLVAIRTGNKLTKEERDWLDEKALKRKDNFNYLKSLNPQTDYFFFNCYTMSSTGKELTYHPEKDIQKLYKLKKNDGVNIEISAIVGKNGSGKSTLLEIIYLAIHNLSVQKGVLLEDGERVAPKNYLRCDLIFQIETSKYILIKFNYDDANHNCKIWESTTSDNEQFKFNKSVSLKKFNFEDLFYNIVLNYSIYGLNDRRIGHWINHLFHKNDSYQTPIVINPMRTNGKFNINNEESFTRARLIANTAIKQEKSGVKNFVTDKQYLSTLFFQLDQKKTEFLEYTDRLDGKIGNTKTRSIEEFIEKSSLPSPTEITRKALEIISEKKVNYKSVPHYEYVENYIVKKIYKIAFTYTRYHSYLIFTGHESPVMFESLMSEGKLDAFLRKLKGDKTHVTMKLRQALNYLINDPLKNDGKHNWIETNLSGYTLTLPFDIFNKRIVGHSDSVINCIPPSLFKVFMNIQNTSNDEPSELEHLSSGELQLINSVQSCLYHLNNLDSYKETTDDSDKIKYRNVLLIFDEVELYFHPEFQRKMIDYLLKEIDSLNLTLVKNIHVLFVTHSPFILSDIPHGKLLKLIDGEPVQDDAPTFAANIYEILKSSFFMDSGTGVYAKQIINDLLDQINHLILLKEHPVKNKDLIKSESKKLVESNVFNTICQIGDDIIRRKLIEMYYLAVDSNKTKEELIKDEIKNLEIQLKNLK